MLAVTVACPATWWITIKPAPGPPFGADASSIPIMTPAL
jgi:hypothetical protein